MYLLCRLPKDVIEHDIHHGGELSLTLGAHGVNAPDL